VGYLLRARLLPALVVKDSSPSLAILNNNVCKDLAALGD
jgi:hypothetical protein